MRLNNDLSCLDIDRPISFATASDGPVDPPDAAETQGGVIPHIPLNPCGDKWLFEKALIGLPGHIIRAVDPYTEADPAANLVHLLGIFGNRVGVSTYLKAGNKSHHPRLFVGMVGGTSSGRKGTSLNVVRSLFELADPDYVSRSVISGASTGEGIVAAFQKQTGVKQIQLVEEELISVLARKSREGNVLSPLIREAFDKDSFEVLTRNNPLKVDNAHLGFIGHVTPEELQASFKRTDYYNGFANRMLWLLVRYSKLLSRNSNVPEEIEQELAARLQESIRVAEQVSEVKLSIEAQVVWDAIYIELKEELTGVIGALTARSEVITLRLAMIYALFDGSSEISKEHLEAAYALWRYSFESVRQIFAPINECQLETRIYDLQTEEWMSRTDLSRLLSGHFSSTEIQKAVDGLSEKELIEVRKVQTGGRPEEQLRRRAEEAN